MLEMDRGIGSIGERLALNKGSKKWHPLIAIGMGSTRGIGLGIAKELARLGANLVLNGFGDAGDIETIRSGTGT